MANSSIRPFFSIRECAAVIQCCVAIHFLQAVRSQENFDETYRVGRDAQTTYITTSG